mmetsp:Transcript_75973/g.164411  ORF Transcript_75973/g.164411 Transcript_75973/m.164411 type:complete len:262 (+) Transcript_75973:46-831(+)
MTSVSPDDVNLLTRPTDGFLCPLSANTYGIEFLQFAIVDYDSKNCLFEVGKDIPPPADMSLDFSSTGEDIYRKIRYNFSEDVLKLPFIQTTLVFAVGDREVRDFRMIERHYFRDQLVKSFDFSFGFCIPGSVNTWESVYSLPPLPDSLVSDMIDNPYETQSDSFYFVNGKLIMHNKASYKYFREDQAQAKKSYEDKFGSKGVKAAKPGDKAAKPAAGFKEEVYLDAADAKTATPVTGEAKSGAKAAAKASDDVWSKESDYI